MKKFFHEYKALRSRTEIKSTTYYERARQRNPSYGREYMKITVQPSLEEEVSSADTSSNTGTMGTEKYKHDLGEFQTRRDASLTPEKNTPNRDTVTEEYNQDLGEFHTRRTSVRELPVTPEKHGGRSANPVSCTSCITGHDKSLAYEKKPPQKTNRKSRLTRVTSQSEINDALPNVHFLFQNQVFMPGSACTDSAPPKHEGSELSRQTVTNSIKLFQDQVDGLTPKVVLPHTPLHRETVPRMLDTEESSSSSRDDKSSHKLEVPSLSSIITGSFNQEKCEAMQQYEDVSESDSESPLFVTIRSEVEVTTSTDESWKFGTWGSLLFQMKKKDEAEIRLLRKCIHPNVIPLMGFFADINSQEYIITERCAGSLYTILHDQNHLPLIKTASRYVLEITNALLFIQLRGYMHSKINSSSIMITPYDIAKLSDLSPCVPLKKSQTVFPKVYSPEPQYINIQGASCNDALEDCQPLISQDSSEEYIQNNCVKKTHTLYENCKHYQWLAPELFSPDLDGFVNVCSKTDVYSLSLVLWETFNAMIPWGTLSYSQLNEQYTILKAGINLPNNGTYPGALLSLLQEGLQLNRSNRTDIKTFYKNLKNVMENLSDDENNLSLSERQFKGEENLFNKSPLLEYLRQLEKINKENKIEPLIDFSSVATLTPVGKTTERLYRSDSTEYCGIMSPEYDDATASTAIPSGSFTSMLVKVPEHSPDPLRSGLRDEGSSSTSAYKFIIHKNCTLPKTPIARKNMLRKNAWLSGCKTPNTSTDNLNSVSDDNTRLNCENDLSYPAKDCGNKLTGNEKFGWQPSRPKVNTNKRVVKKSLAELEEISKVKPLISLYEENILKQTIQRSPMQKHGSWEKHIHFALWNTAAAFKKAVQNQKQVVRACFGTEINITATVCDQDGVNIRALKLLGATVEDPTITVLNKVVVTLLDTPHLLKCFRNLFMKYDIECPTNVSSDDISYKGVAKWAHIQDFFNVDNKKSKREE